MNRLESKQANRIPLGLTRAALACLLAMWLGVPAMPTRAGSPDNVPTASAGMGPCTADFLVTDAASKPVYNAQIQVALKYGFMSKRDTAMQVGTDSNGKARFEGLPDKLKKPPMVFSVSSGDQSKSVSNDPAANCHATFTVALGK